MLGRMGAAIGSLLLAVMQQVPAVAQEWPQRPIRVIVGFGAGGGTDIVARILSQPLSEVLGQPVVIENRPGAGGTIAADVVAKAPKDGYVVSGMSTGHTVSAALYKSLPFHSANDFAAVSLMGETAYILVTHKDSPFNNIKDLVAAAKANPGKLNFGTVGIGSTQHFAAELLRLRAGIEVKHIPYRNSPAVMAALRAKELDFIAETLAATSGLIKSGDLKVLGLTTPKRWSSASELPTIAEQGFDVDVVGWYGLAFPAGTPAPIVDKMNRAMRDVLARDGVKKQIADAGAIAAHSTPQDFAKQITSEITKFEEIRTKAGIPQQ